MYKKIMISLVFAASGLLSSETVKGQAKDPLLFPKDNFTVETKSVKTSAGERRSLTTLSCIFHMLPTLLTKITRA